MSERDILDKDDLIVRLMSGLYGLRMGTAELVADFIIADRKSTVHKVVGPLKEELSRPDTHLIDAMNAMSKSLKLAEEVCK